jgi:hypothetical protein
VTLIGCTYAWSSCSSRWFCSRPDNRALKTLGLNTELNPAEIIRYQRCLIVLTKEREVIGSLIENPITKEVIVYWPADLL